MKNYGNKEVLIKLPHVTNVNTLYSVEEDVLPKNYKTAIPFVITSPSY